MRYSGIGGQAVMEGVMMKNGDDYAIAVRTPDQKIVVENFVSAGLFKNKTVKNIRLDYLPGIFMPFWRFSCKKACYFLQT